MAQFATIEQRMTPQELQLLEASLEEISVFKSNQMNPFLQSKQDLYAVEIKSKVIAMFFKFFQREEQSILKTAKKCLTRLLRKEVNPQEALPNFILKECVRPSLNIISQRSSTPAQFEQLTRLIQVLHACFNEQLGRHMMNTYTKIIPRFSEEFKLHMLGNVPRPPQ